MVVSNSVNRPALIERVCDWLDNRVLDNRHIIDEFIQLAFAAKVEGYHCNDGQALHECKRFNCMIKEKRNELESMCRLYAKRDTWDKFIAYESKMRVKRKQEAEARQRQIAATIRFISWGVIAAISIGGFALLYFFAEFSRGLK